VSVGNLAVGGTGKTPFTRWIAAELEASGAATWVLVGAAGADEANLHRRWNARVPVVVDRDRCAGAERARAAGAEVAVLDDGFQHTALARDLDIVLVSADDLFPGSILPCGPYREPVSALGRASVVVVTGRSATAERMHSVAALVEGYRPGLALGIAALDPGALARLDGSRAVPPRGDVLAVCAVARPAAFARAVGEMVEGTVELVSFADHHPYDRSDVERIRRRAGERTIVTTEKDAVKLEPWSADLGDAVVLHDRLRWERGEGELRERLLTVVGRGRAA
jgi:tetraacyldisaccharide 4'-kinase